MRILLCGARGFIGERVFDALQQAGHEVVRGVRAPQPAPGCEDWPLPGSVQAA